MPGRGSGVGDGLSSEQMILLVVGIVAAGVVVARWRSVLAAVGGWLTEHRLLTPAGNAGLQIPYLGGLDLPRILIVVGAAAVGVVVWRMALRHRRRQQNRAR